MNRVDDPLPSWLVDIEADLKAGLFPLRAFNDQELHEMELQRIFARCWVYIGHESEIPNPGDFATRNIGRDPFILIRSDDGAIRVLFNSCRHRAATICRVERGNATQFTCPFHGWSYKNSGELVGVFAKREGYRALNMSDWGLFSAAKVANYGGLIFATLDPNARSFESYLGKFKWYFDIQFKLSKGGMEVLGEPHRWIIDANWKQGAENFCGDSAHTPITHKSALDAGMVRKEFSTMPGKRFRLHVHDCDGHAISIRQVEEGGTAFWDYPEEVTRHFTAGSLAPAQFDLAKRALNHNGTLFPNFSFLHFSFTDSADRTPAGFLSIRVWQPKGPGKTEIWNWIMAPKEASEAYKKRAYRVGMSSFGPSGSFEQDDVAVWPGIAQSADTVFADRKNIKLNYQMGLGDMGDTAALTNWPGPGHAVPSSAGEGGLRTFHNSWYDWIARNGGAASAT